MTMPLTATQEALLSYIDYKLKQDGVAPTYVEMMARLNTKSRGKVHGLLRALEERGRIRRLPYRARAIELLEEAA